MVIAGCVLFALTHTANNPGLSDSLEESKRRGVFVAEYGVVSVDDSLECADSVVCIHRAFPMPEEIWLEHQWRYGTFPWMTVPTKEAKYGLFLRYTEEDLEAIIDLGIPLRFRYATLVEGKKVGSKLLIPRRLEIFMHKVQPDTIRLFLDSRDEPMLCQHNVVLARKR